MSGSHREVGAQIGAACGDVLREAVSFDAEIPDGRSRADLLQSRVAEQRRLAKWS